VLVVRSCLKSLLGSVVMKSPFDFPDSTHSVESENVLVEGYNIYVRFTSR
jgi:hypothetical protein